MKRPRNAEHQRAWRQRQKVLKAELLEALLDATAHLAAATSAYREYAGNSKRPGRRDAFYNTRLKDFEKAVGRASEVIRRCTVTK